MLANGPGFSNELNVYGDVPVAVVLGATKRPHIAGVRLDSLVKCRRQVQYLPLAS